MDFSSLERKTKAELFELIQSKQEEVNRLQKEIDALQKRIDEALDHTVNHGGYDDLPHIIKILKGK